MGKRSVKSVFGGAGFYIALLLCVAAVGVAGYFVLFSGNSEEPVEPVGLPEPVEVSDPEPVDLEPQTQEAPPSDPVAEKEPDVVTVAQMPEVQVSAEQPRLTVKPVSGETVAAFSMEDLQYDETMEDWRTHNGMDIQADKGTQVMAATAGTVDSVYDDPLLGTTVVLSHSGGYQTIYACLQGQPTVSAGDSVTTGQVIGCVGESAIAEAGAHLHFGVTREGVPIDPEEFLNR
ncbi:peptidoglycan DD-metalloendopeptidase family protein [Oscillibacter sp. MSJ-2]|uniref:Peptidoglycan DD-metalloendopeptidase family protein n=1 Tax=Dysosmobacter acutus TaxID=2841504 RepID=A0ABS6F601_9FIRM|nr:peptidoglycan DD-metalloendopeptidase family protein [Dysosmobacter acutus]MBU5625726.1 peptidoglycan DD-metalloendopeptidase family protein [Dysosmobacter acutus]